MSDDVLSQAEVESLLNQMESTAKPKAAAKARKAG